MVYSKHLSLAKIAAQIRKKFAGLGKRRKKQKLKAPEASHKNAEVFRFQKPL